MKLRRAGVIIDRLPSRRIASLLGYLALHEGWQAREQVAEAVWSEQEQGRATASLRNALSILRRVLEPDVSVEVSAIEANRTHIRLIQDRCECDVWSFLSAIEHHNYFAALNLYQGQLLNGIDDEWIEPAREQIRTAFALAASAEAREALDRGLAHRALEVARLWRESDPFEPEATRLIAFAEADSGLVKTALDTIERYASWYEKELGKSPPIDVQAIRDEIRSRGNRNNPTKSEGVLENLTLPIYLTKFFGRETELDYISSWSRSDSYLLNVVGMGGMGKTRLAVEAASSLPSEWKAVFVPLVGVQSKESAVYAISNALGLRDSSQTEPLEALRNYLCQASGRIIFVLDNLEQILNPISELLPELIRWNHRAKFLCTSREVLGIEGEAVLSLSSFQVREADLFSEGLTGNSAVELFFDRAKNARFDFALNDQTFKEVLALCRELDALPLAIEIMAAWAGTWSVSDMRKNVRNQHVPARAKSHEPRHRSLEACIEWSFQLLDETSQRRLCVLSMFRGGWTAEAASALLDISEIDSILATFVDRSLISPVDVESQRRFSMLEMVREFCQRRLETQAAKDAAPRFVAYFRSLAAALANPCAGPQEASNHRALDRERDNVEAAIEMCEQGLATTDEGFWLLGSLGLHWSYRGQTRDGLSLIYRLLALPQGPAGVGTIMGLQALSVLNQAVNDLEQAESALRKMEEVSEQIDDPFVKFRVINQIGNFHNRFGHFEDAGRWHGQALELADQLVEPRFSAVSHCNLAESLFGRGLNDQAVEHWRIAVDLDSANGNVAGEAMLFLGFAYCLGGHFQVGAKKLETYLRNVWHLGFAQGIARGVYFSSLPAVGLGQIELGSLLRSSALRYITDEGLVLDALENQCAALIENKLGEVSNLTPDHDRRLMDIHEAVDLALRFMVEVGGLAAVAT